MALYRDPYMRMRELAGLDPAAEAQEVPLATPEERDREQRRAIAAGRSDFSNAFSAGVEDIKASGYTARGLLRIGVGDEQGGVADVERAREISDKANEFQRGPQSYTEVHSLGDAASYVGNSLARLSPQIGLGVLTGGTGGLVEGGAAAALRSGLTRAAVNNVAGRRAATRGAAEAVASRSLQERARRRVGATLGEDFVTKRTKAGATKGALASSVTQQTALAQQTVLDEESPDSIQTRALKAGVGSVVTGAMDALPIVRLLSRYGIGDVAKQAVGGGVAKRVLHHAAQQGLAEGSTELAQAIGEQATHKWVNANVELLSPEALSDYINSAAMGFIGGGAFGAPGGLRGVKLSSEPGKKWAEKFTGYVKKLLGKPQGRPAAPAEGAAPSAPDASAPSGVMDTGIDLGEIARGLKEHAPKPAEGAVLSDASLGAQMKDVAASVQANYDSFMGDTFVANSLSRIVEATPFESTNTSYGTQVFNDGNGIEGAKNLIPAGRLRELRSQFPDMHPYHAAVMAMIPDKLKAGELNNDGTLAEMTRVLLGEDPDTIDDGKVKKFFAALPDEDARSAFAHTAATFREVKETPDFNADIPDEKNAVAVGGEEDVRRGVQPDAPLTTIPVRQLGIGAVVNKKAPLGDNEIALSKTDRNGRVTVRRMSGASIGQLIRTLREQDQDFARLSQREQVVGALNELAQRGHNIDPKTLPRGLKLGNNWFVPPEQMAAIKNGLTERSANKDGTLKRNDGTPRFALRQQTTEPGARTKEQESALNKEFGQGELSRVLAREPRFDPEQGRVDEVGDETRKQGDPVVRAPAQAPVQGTRAALIGQGTDTRARRVAPLQVATDTARENLDKLIVRVTQHSTDAAVDLSSNEGRLEAYRLARRMAGSVERGRLEEAAAAYKAARIAEREALKVKKTDKVQTPDTARIAITPEEAVDRGKVDTKTLKKERAAEREPADQDRNSIEYLDAQEKFRLGQLQRAKKTGNEAAATKHRKALYAIRKTRGELYPKSDKKSEPRTSIEARLKARLRNNIAQDAAKKIAVRKAARDGIIEEKVPNVADRTLGKDAFKANERAKRQARRARNIDREPPALPDIAPGTTTLTGVAPKSGSVVFAAAGFRADLQQGAKSLSRRELAATLSRIADSNLPEAAKARLIAEGQRLYQQLSANSAIVAEAHNRRGIEKARTVEHLAAAIEALDGAVSNGEASTVEEALGAVSHLMTPQQRLLFTALRKLGAIRNVRFVLRRIHTFNNPVGGMHAAFLLSNDVLKAVDAQGNEGERVELTIPAFVFGDKADPAQDLVAVLLHEAIHASTTYAEQLNPQARGELKALLKHARAEAAKLGVDINAVYGLSETQEFLAEAFTNNELQQLLQRIAAPNGEKGSAWDAFKAWVAKLLGFDAKTPQAQRDALDAIFDLGLRMAQETGAARDVALSELFAGPTENTAVDESGIEEIAAAPPPAAFGGAVPANSVVQTPASGSQPSDYMALLSPQNRAYLEATLRRGDVYRQVRTTLPADLQRVLDSADQGPSLLVNTGLALALQGKLDLSPDSKGFIAAVQALWDVISKVLQVPSKGAYGREIIRQIKGGADAKKVDAEAALLTPAALRVHAYIKQRIRPVMAALLRDMDSRMRSTGVPALTQLATLLSQRTGEFRADREVSLSARTLKARNEHLNKAFEIIGKWDAETKARVLKELQEKREKVSPEAAQLRAFYKDMYAYLRIAGLPVKETQDYFPVAISPESILARPDEFLSLLDNFSETIRGREVSPLRDRQRAIKREIAARAKKTGEDAAPTPEEREELSRLAHQIAGLNKATPRELSQRVMDYAVKRNGDSHVGNMTFADGDHDPVFRPLNARVMDYIYEQGTPQQIATFATFQDQSLERTTVHYINRGTRRAEWTRAQLDRRVPDLLRQAEEQGATPEQLKLARDHVDMMMGAYGADYNPYIKRIAETFGVNLPPFEKWQKLQAALTTYQNLRLLPLAAMSSLIDPLGVAVRSGGLRGTFDAYKKALAAMRSAQGEDSLRQLAHSMGIVERHAVSEALVHLYGSINDPTGRAAKINSALFRFNGLEYITKFSRLAALASANNFLLYHAQRSDAQSTRYLAELGLTPKDIKAGADGYVVRSEKIDAALNRFVNESVVRPTPGQRPGWQNDPNFQLAAQYKGYLYSFFNTITRRALHEVDKGNLAVLLPLLMYLPVTAVGELLRDFLQNDGKSKDSLDYAKLSVSRSGLLGPQLGSLVDTRGDWKRGHVVLNTVGGPTGQQLGKLYDTAMGRGWQSPGEQVETALPGSALYKEWN